MNIKEAKNILGTDLGIPGKMPSWGFSLPPKDCITGSKLRTIPNSVCSKCYAFRGNYFYPGPKAGMEKRLAALNHPQWVDAMTDLISIRYKDSNIKYFRWHDAGDLQSIQHLENIAEVARRLPAIRFWIPTREYGIVKDWIQAGNTKPDNLVIRLSGHMINGPTPEKLARELNVLTSGVHLHGFKLAKEVKECKAYTRSASCGKCRFCWNGEGPVSYPKH